MKRSRMLAAAAMVVSFHPTGAKAAPTGGTQPVVVTNTTSSPVPVVSQGTTTVSVSGTPRVQIDPATTPLMSVKPPASFQRTFPVTIPAGGQVTTGVLRVLDPRELVLESFGMLCQAYHASDVLLRNRFTDATGVQDFGNFSFKVDNSGWGGKVFTTAFDAHSSPDASPAGDVHLISIDVSLAEQNTAEENCIVTLTGTFR
jgi:hypothetical protein